jgi:hypothetical protein
MTLTSPVSNSNESMIRDVQKGVSETAANAYQAFRVFVSIK